MAIAVSEETGVIAFHITGGIAVRLFGLPLSHYGRVLASQVVGAVTDLVTGRAAAADRFGIWNPPAASDRVRHAEVA